MQKRCPHLLEKGGELPRVGDPEEDVDADRDDEEPKLRKVSIPALDRYGIHTLKFEDRGEAVCDVEVERNDVYALLSSALPKPPLMRAVDFRELLEQSVLFAQGGTRAALDLTYSAIDSLRKKGDLSVDLFEAVVLEHAWHDKLASIPAAARRVAWQVEESCSGEGVHEELRSFLVEVLAVAVGSLNRQPPTLPPFGSTLVAAIGDENPPTFPSLLERYAKVIIINFHCTCKDDVRRYSSPHFEAGTGEAARPVRCVVISCCFKRLGRLFCALEEALSFPYARSHFIAAISI